MIEGKTDEGKAMEKKESLEHFHDASHEWRRIFAECWGTFLLVLVATGATVVGALSGEIPKVVQVAAPGMMVMVIIYFMGAVSGAHINPSVTLAFAVRGHFPWNRVPAYILAQLAGGILASLFIKGMFGEVEKLGATFPKLGLDNWQAFLIEVLLTVGLVNTILGTASGARNIGKNGGLAVGSYIVLAGFWAAPLTGASMNIARSLAPDIVRGDFSYSWIYILGPLTGAMVAVAFEWILKGKPSRHATLEAQGLADDSKDED